MKEILQHYKHFADNFVLRFPEKEQPKVREPLDFLMASKTRALEAADIEDLFYVFSEEVLEKGTIHYKEFASWKEIENWNPAEKIEQAYLILSVKKDTPMSDIVRICNSLKQHFSNSDSENHFGTYYLENEENLPSKMIYVSQLKLS